MKLKKTIKYLYQALAGMALALIPAHGGTIFSDNFDGAATSLNGTAPDSRPGAETWVTTNQFNADGSFTGGPGGSTGGSATLAFTPAQGVIYTIDTSATLTVSGSGAFLGFGFADGQSTMTGSGTRFSGPTVTGRAWSFYRANTNNPTAAMDGTTSSPVWTPWTDTNEQSVDMRIVLDTTGGAGTWTATWFAKLPGDENYTEVRAASALLTETITSIGFCVSGDNANGTIDSFSLSDNQAATAPALVSTVPADDATGIAPDSDLVATFNKTIQLGASGTITIKNLTTSTNTVISLPGPDVDGTLTVDGNQLTIDPTASLGVPGDEFAIEISSGAVESAEAVGYPGILSTDDPNWSFTIDNIPPAPSYFQPLAGSNTAPLDGALFIAFKEAPVIGSGNLVIHRTSNNSIVESFDVDSLIVNGNRVTILPTVPLAYNTSYYVLIDTGAFTDELGNGYGITDPAVWTFSTIANDPNMLFCDSFNREDGYDLDASARGKYGALGPLNYTQWILGPGNVGNVELTSGQLLLESNENNGNAGALVYPEHDFTDAAIASAGGFSITVDLNANVSGGTGRYLSVALGRTAADIDAQTSATAGGCAETADLVVALRNNNTLWIYENGTNVTGSGLADAPATPAKMRIECMLADFNDGSTVNYEVFFNDSATAFASGSFDWTGTKENYISLSSNLLQTFTVGERHALFDNLQIRSLGAAGGFSSWITGAFANGTVPAGKRGPNDDADNDGISNLVEYAIAGQDPTVANASIGAFTGGKLAYAKRSGASGLAFAIEESIDLGMSDAWKEVPPGPSYTNDAATISYELPGGPAKDFLRLQVLSN